MLSLKNTSPATCTGYFLREIADKSRNRWHGKAADKLQLHGEINEDQFKNIIDGFSPDATIRLIRRKVNDENRRAALDCTLSAPKTVSLLSLVGDNEDALIAHREAVKSTLDYIEDNLIETRISIDKKQIAIPSTNLLIAQFEHIESRRLDPQLHTHCLILNMTEVNNKWYSILNRNIFKNKASIGAIYQNHLANSLRSQGYDIVPKGKNQFDIKGFSDEQINAFSKRRQQIIIAVGQSASAKEKHRACLNTRDRKKHIDPAQLKQQWINEAKRLGIDFQNLKNQPKEINNELRQMIKAMDGDELIKLINGSKDIPSIREILKLDRDEIIQKIQQPNQNERPRLAL